MSTKEPAAAGEVVAVEGEVAPQQLARRPSAAAGSPRRRPRTGEIAARLRRTARGGSGRTRASTSSAVLRKRCALQARRARASHHRTRARARATRPRSGAAWSRGWASARPSGRRPSSRTSGGGELGGEIPGVARGGVAQCAGVVVVGSEPGRRAPVQPRRLIGKLRAQLGAQQLGEQRVIAMPGAVLVEGRRSAPPCSSRASIAWPSVLSVSASASSALSGRRPTSAAGSRAPAAAGGRAPR